MKPGPLFSAMLLSIVATPAVAADLFTPGNFAGLAADRKAAQRGDIVTIIVYENASATNAASSGTKKNAKLDGRISAGSFDEGAGLSLGGSSSNEGSTGRSGRMVAQISAVVDEVLPNGDLRVTGEQLLNLNGERTFIRVRGRVRPADISPANAVLSSRLADAVIVYNGSGFMSRSARPGFVATILGWLGLL